MIFSEAGLTNLTKILNDIHWWLEIRELNRLNGKLGYLKHRISNIHLFDTELDQIWLDFVTYCAEKLWYQLTKMTSKRTYEIPIFGRDGNYPL